MSDSTHHTAFHPDPQRLSIGLLSLRLGVGLVFLMWTLDKFLNPDHTAAVFEKFYMIPGLGATVSYLLGAAQLVLVIAFLAGAFRTYSYALIGLLHAASTLSSYSQYLNPYESTNLLFFAAIPMLAACWVLWSLRQCDTLSFDHWRHHAGEPTTSESRHIHTAA